MNSQVHALEETQIPRTAADKGKYFLLEKKVNGHIVQTLHKRVGIDSVGYTLSEINCTTKKFRQLGYSEESAKAIKTSPSNWTDLISGSSKSDLANFVCKK
jgi:hypothetical protein